MYTDPFRLTATIYDQTSRFVPYDLWAGFIHELLDEFGNQTIQTVVELSAGTGSFRSFFDRPGIKTYIGLDISWKMLEAARLKMSDCSQTMDEIVANSQNIPIKSGTADLVLHLFDSINYHTKPEEVLTVFHEVNRILKPGGLYIFDFTTPANSINNTHDDFSEFLEDQAGSYERLSEYSEEKGIHTTEFVFTSGNEKIHEYHIERPYPLRQMKKMVSSLTGWKSLIWIDEFERNQPGTEKSERIHVVIRKEKC